MSDSEDKCPGRVRRELSHMIGPSSLAYSSALGPQVSRRSHFGDGQLPPLPQLDQSQHALEFRHSRPEKCRTTHDL